MAGTINRGQAMRGPGATLWLEAATAAHLNCELEAPAQLGVLLDAVVPASWPPATYDHDVIAFFKDQTEAGGEAAAGWYVWYAMAIPQDGPRTLIGGGGYFGPPENGVVEIGYAVLPAWQGRGYGSEMVRQLVDRALACPEATVRQVVAHTEVGNAASQAVLRRNGFVVTPEVGAGDRLYFVRDRRYTNQHQA